MTATGQLLSCVAAPAHLHMHVPLLEASPDAQHCLYAAAGMQKHI